MKKYQHTNAWNIFLEISILIASTVIGCLFRIWGLHETNVVIVYIFSVLLISRFTVGYLYGITASIVSLLLFNWFFTEPYFTLKVNDMTYLITFAIMMFTSIFTSTLTTKVKQTANDAKEREKESNALYQMTNLLSDAEDAEDISKITIAASSEILGCNTSCICFDEKGNPEKTFLQRKDNGGYIRRELSFVDELKLRDELLSADTVRAGGKTLFPIFGKNNILAVLRAPQSVGATMSAAQIRMLHSIIESAAMAFERLRSLQEQARSREETIQERYRGNLLRAISHDIRTPLSGIMGTSEMLMHTSNPEEIQYKLAKDIYKDAQWLHGMVENILNLTKLRDGKLELNKQPEAVEEVIGAALAVMEKRLPNRVINVDMPENVVMVPMDAGLISQVLINLLDNADKHTAQDQEITIFVTLEKKNVNITVADRGVGIPESDLPHVFQMFYTTGGRSADSKRGVGLGLSICQSIVEAHGGVITAENREGGGAAFTFNLPLGGET